MIDFKSCIHNLCKIYAKESFGVFLVWLTFSVPRSLFNWEVPKCFGLFFFFFKSQTRRLEHWLLSEPTVRAQHHISAPLQRPALSAQSTQSRDLNILWKIFPDIQSTGPQTFLIQIHIFKNK